MEYKHALRETLASNEITNINSLDSYKQMGIGHTDLCVYFTYHERSVYIGYDLVDIAEANHTIPISILWAMIFCE